MTSIEQPFSEPTIGVSEFKLGGLERPGPQALPEPGAALVGENYYEPGHASGADADRHIVEQEPHGPFYGQHGI